MPPASGGEILEVVSNDALVSDELRAAALALWDRCTEKLKSQVTPQSFTTWFEPLSAVSLEGTRLVLFAPSAFIAEWVLQHYQVLIETVLAEFLGQSAEIGIEHSAEVEGVETALAPITVVQSSAPATEAANRFDAPSQPLRENKQQSVTPVAKPPLNSNLNPNYTFDSFI
ncbi:MAG TPA: DnaA N-terminal domain-containing protein, partial [Steroidobacteraceae bacterium]|nr:DnaA N-terminal domain-containing protein [Steroidobacteraceae bacterium]